MAPTAEVTGRLPSKKSRGCKIFLKFNLKCQDENVNATTENVYLKSLIIMTKKSRL